MVAITLRSHTTTDRLDKIIYEVLQEDLQTVLRFVAAEAIEEQRRLQNPPTSLLIDNSGGKSIDFAQKRVQAFFGNIEDLRLAVRDAWQLIQDRTRVATGTARSSYQVWFKEQRIGSSPAAIDPFLQNFNPATDYFRIVGPVLVYGRKVYWNPVGAPNKPPRTQTKTLRVPGLTVKLIRIRGIMNQVEQIMKRRYRGLAITEDWVVTSALPKDGRTPGMWFGFRRRGTLLGSSNG